MQNFGGHDVAMNQPRLMSRGHSPVDVHENARRLQAMKRPAASQDFLSAASFDQLHNDGMRAVRRADVVHGDDVGMIELGRSLCFEEKTGATRRSLPADQGTGVWPVLVAANVRLKQCEILAAASPQPNLFKEITSPRLNQRSTCPGRMGIVCEAEKTLLNRRVAIKQLSKDVSSAIQSNQRRCVRKRGVPVAKVSFLKLPPDQAAATAFSNQRRRT